MSKCEKQEQVQIDLLHRIFAHVKFDRLWLAASITVQVLEDPLEEGERPTHVNDDDFEMDPHAAERPGKRGH